MSLGAGLLVLVVAVVYFAPEFSKKDTNILSPIKFVQISLGDTLINAEVASSPSQRTLGLGGRVELSEDTGMFFIFSEPGLPGIWMKGMLIPLDIIWIDEDYEIVHVAKDVSPDSYPEVYYPTIPASYVLEVNAGTVDKSGILVGQKIVISHRARDF